MNLTDKRKSHWYQLFIVFISSIAVGIYRDGFVSLFPFIQNEFHLTRAQLGLHSSFLFSASSIAVLFAGRLVDLKGTKWGIIAGLFFMGCNLAFFCI